MNFNLYVLQNQWIVATLLAGVALTLLFCLTYSAMWRPREQEKQSESEEVKDVRAFARAFLSVVPWALIILALVTASYTVISLALRSCIPPNW
jgi:type II secretory pathway component PulM